MPNFTYNRDVPFGPNNPSVDQGPMLQNTNSIDDLIDIDHYAFNDNFGGLHKQVTMINQSAPGFPNGGDGLLFAGVNGGNSWPHWQNSLGTTLLVNGIPTAATNGYTYLPGGLLLQWGQKSLPGTTGSIDFTDDGNIDFTTIYNVQLTTSSISNAGVFSQSNSGFQYVINGTPSVLYWVAIGSK